MKKPEKHIYFILVLLFICSLAGAGMLDKNLTENSAAASLQSISHCNADFEISTENLRKLKINRDLAVEKGVLLGDAKGWISAEISACGTPIGIEMRLKGDWTDHLKGSKWSFRIRTKGKDTFNGLHVFSLQDPTTR